MEAGWIRTHDVVKFIYYCDCAKFEFEWMKSKKKSSKSREWGREMRLYFADKLGHFRS